MHFKLLYNAVLAILTASLFTSCQKEISYEIDGGTPPPGGNNSAGKPKTMTEISIFMGDTVANITYNLSYDAQQRLTLMQVAGSPGDRFEFAYYTSYFSTKLFNSSVMEIYSEHYFSGNNRIDSSMQYNTSMDTTTEKYRYNAKGQIASISEYDYTAAGGSIETERTTLTYDAKGNVISEQSSGGTATYTYYDNLKTPFDIMSPYGHGSPYLVKTASQAGVVLNYTYKFDTKNRLIQEEAKETAGTMTLVKLYGW